MRGLKLLFWWMNFLWKMQLNIFLTDGLLSLVVEEVVGCPT